MKLIITLILALCLCACTAASPTDQTGGEKYILSSETEGASEEISASCTVTFSGDGAEISGDGAALRDGDLLISRGGDYLLTGNFSGTVTVDITKEEKATLTLSSLTVNSEGAAIYVVSADKVTLLLAGESTLSDGKTYADGSGAEPSACIFSADDLEIGGEGSLTVLANCKNGIESKNDVKIKDGSITVTAARNAVKGKDLVEISGGSLNVTACYDGIKSDNEKEDGRGNITVSGGNITLNCTDDGLQATRSVSVTGGKLTVSARDDKINCDGEVFVAENCIN